MKPRNVVLAGALALALVAVPGAVAAFVGEPEPADARHDTAPHAVSAREREANAGADATREAVPGEAVDAADSAGVRVHVMTADGNPVAGATVRFWPRRSKVERERDKAWLEEHDDDLEVALTRSGSALVTGADGAVRIDARLLDPDGSAVAVRLGELYGEGYADTEEAECLIEVQRDIGLDLEVVDTLGRPQLGVVVDIGTEGLSLRDGLQRNHTESRATDSCGRVRVPHVQSIPPDAIAGRIRVWCERHVADTTALVLAEQTVPWEQLSAKTAIRLVVPAGGAIAARVTDADGHSMDAWVWLRDEAGESYELRAARVDDRLWFRGLPPGRRWTVVARPGLGRDIPDTIVPVAGPVSADDIVEIDIPLPYRQWSFRGTLVRSDGLPLTSADIAWICPELAIDATFSTGGDRLRTPFGMFPAHITRVRHLELRVESPMVAPQVFRFERMFVPGINDLGELVLSPPALERVLASVEVRGAGRPLTATARVWLRTSDETVETTARQRDGRIELLGTPPGEPMSVGCGHDGWLTARIPVALGEHRVVDLERAAMLTVPFVPAELPADWIEAELRSLDRTGDPELAERHRSTFRWECLQPGRYSLQIRAAGRIVHDEPELVLHAGAQRWPPEPKHLDLSGRVSAFRIVAREPAPARDLLSVEALCIAVNGALPTGLDDARLPENCFLPPAEPFDLLVRVRGFVPHRIHNPRGDVVLDMQPMTLVGLHSAPTEWETIRVRIQVDGVRDPVLRAFDKDNSHEVETDHEKRGRLFLAPGTVIEVCLVRDGKTTPSQTIVVGTTSPQEVEVR